MVPLLVSVWLAGCSGSGPASDPVEIMRRVGCNQDRALAARLGFVYDQKLLLRLHRANGKLARQERREYTVAPTASGTEKKLTHFEGAYAKHGRMVPYDKPGYEYKGVDIDGALIDGLAGDLTGDKDSRDGIASDLFPLTTREQRGYAFHLEGREDYRGRPAVRVSFEPKRAVKGADADDDGDASWKGEALIDAQEYQPVWVETKLAWKVPGLVKVLLGTNVEGLGFSVSYAKFADGVWFPVSYGGEFYVRAVFFYARNISVSLENKGFSRAQAATSIHYGGEAAPEAEKSPRKLD